MEKKCKYCLAKFEAKSPYEYCDNVCRELVRQKVMTGKGRELSPKSYSDKKNICEFCGIEYYPKKSVQGKARTCGQYSCKIMLRRANANKKKNGTIKE